MIPTPAELLALVRQYGDAIDKAVRCVPGSAEEGYWITQGANVYAALAKTFNAPQNVVNAANDLEIVRHRNKSASYMDFCLWYALEQLALIPAPDEDTQPVDVSAVLDALEY